MQLKPRVVLLNPVSLLGAVMAVFSLVITLVLLVLGATGTIANPYTGILTFIGGPAALALGLILIPIGAVRERARLARLGMVAKEYPALDLNDPRQRRGVAVFTGVTAGILSLMVVTTYGAAEFMETQEFCGAVCHRVMDPESAAYAASPHARVKCVSCHIGPGAPWLVKAKISGLRQVFNYSFDRFERPLVVPIKDLRPSRDTCEQCHWPDRFYGDQFRPFVHYGTDEQNTARSQPLVFRIGGSEEVQGIHWHTTAKVWYLPLDEARAEIGWVRVEKPDGSVDEYVLPERKAEVTPALIQSEERFMDCMDCHNRAAHHFAPFEDEVDSAMSRGSISSQIPYIKQQAMKAVGEIGPQASQDQHNQTLQRIDAITTYYQTQQPQVYSKYQSQVKQAVGELKNIYSRIVFPEMKIVPGTYSDWVGHNGCMRCHGKLVGVSGEVTGKTIEANCLNCHYPAPYVPSGPESAGPAQLSPKPILPATIPHPTEGREACNSCHIIGGQGIGATGGTGIADDHKGRDAASCLGCHAAAQSLPTASAPAAAGRAPAASTAPSGSASAAQPAAPAAAPVAARAPGVPAIPHPTQGREQCTTCHTTTGPGVGGQGGTGTPADHQGRGDALCAGCHKPQ